MVKIATNESNHHNLTDPFSASTNRVKGILEYI